MDPGESGGIALISPEGQIITAFKRPETEREIYDAIASLWMDVEFAYIEEVASRPKQNVAAMFKFGKGYGALRMALVACRIPFEAVRPQVWQARMGCLTHGDKKISRAKAQAMWPDFKITHAIADAAIIGEFARRIKMRLF